MKQEFVVSVLTALLVTAVPASAGDGAAVYKSKCSGCHGADGEGKPAVKAPALKGTQLDAGQIAQHVMKGEATSKPPHNKAIAGLSEDQATAVAEYIKALK